MYRLIIVAAFSIIAGFAQSDELVTPLAPGFRLEGHTAAELSASWWQWAMSAPQDINPVADLSGAHCDVGQQGNIWFLAGGSVRR